MNLILKKSNSEPTANQDGRPYELLLDEYGLCFRCSNDGLFCPKRLVHRHPWCREWWKSRGASRHVFRSDDGDLDLKCPTEVAITDRREKEISDLGFLPLCHYKDKDYAVFFGAQTTQKPKLYNQADATANAAISARLPYMMATSRIAHYLKCIARDKIGSFMEREDAEQWLNRWIMDYVSPDPDVTEPNSLCARPRSPWRMFLENRGPTTRSPICGPGCSLKS